MKTKTKFRLLLSFSLVCLIGLVGMTVQLWNMNDRLAQLAPETPELPPSIEQRLLAELDKKDAAFAQRRRSPLMRPFADFDQIQSYIDSLFPSLGSPVFSAGAPFSASSFGSSLVSSAEPDIAVDETDEAFRILIPLNSEQEIELSTNVEHNSVSVSGVITERSQQSQNNISTSFMSQRQFAKTLNLPSPIDEFSMTSEQTDAGIEITIPKKTS